MFVVSLDLLSFSCDLSVLDDLFGDDHHLTGRGGGGGGGRAAGKQKLDSGLLGALSFTL